MMKIYHFKFNGEVFTTKQLIFNEVNSLPDGVGITAKTICKQLPHVNGLDAIKVLDQLVSEKLIKRVDRNYFKK